MNKWIEIKSVLGYLIEKLFKQKSVVGRLKVKKALGGYLSEKSAGGRVKMAYVWGGGLLNSPYGMGGI